MHHVCEGTFEDKRGHQMPLELELQVAESHLMWVLGMKPKSLCKSNNYSQPVGHLSSSTFLFFTKS